MNRNHQEVQVWLERIFAGDNVPSYELNHRTIQILYDLMNRNESKDHDTQLIIDDHRQKAEEYHAEGRRLDNILQSVNLTPGTLSQSGVMSLRTLANLALLLQIKDASDTSYLLALQHLHDELGQLADARKTEQRTISKLMEKTKSALIKYNSLKKAFDVLEEQADHQHPDMEKRAKQTDFLRNKSKEYKAQIQKCQIQLQKSGADPSLYHQELVKKSEELQALKEEIAPLKTKLQTYHSLPPDIALTKVKIEELRQQVGALEAELSKRIDLMHM